MRFLQRLTNTAEKNHRRIHGITHHIQIYLTRVKWPKVDPGKSILNNKDRKDHIRKVNDRLTCSFSKCEFKPCVHPAMKNHVAQVHTEVIMFNCKICDTVSKSVSKFQDHLTSVHSKEKPIFCGYPECDFKSNYRSQLNYHMKRHTGEKPFQCSLCPSKFYSDHHLKRHVDTSHRRGKKQFNCSVCSKSFYTSSSLKIHMCTHTGEKPFKCSQPNCSHSASRMSLIRLHLMTHTGEKPHSCAFCQYKCSVKASLVLHMRRHTGEKPFPCSHPNCSYVASSNSNLKNHIMRKHTDGGRNFECNYCQKLFVTSSDLVKHVRMHTGEKPFSCRFCKKELVCASKRCQHERTCKMRDDGQLIRPYKCHFPGCDYASGIQSNLTRHCRDRKHIKV